MVKCRRFFSEASELLPGIEVEKVRGGKSDSKMTPKGAFVIVERVKSAAVVSMGELTDEVEAIGNNKDEIVAAGVVVIEG